MVFIGISIVRGLMKTANEKAERERRLAQRGAPNRKQRVQSEIEAFLQEVGGGNRENAPAENDAGARREERRRRIQEKKARARRDQQEQRRQQKILQEREETRQRRQRETAAASTPRRNVGSGISEHVDEYINKHVSEHIDHDVEEYVEATIVDSVEDHLGSRDIEMPQRPHTTRGSSSDASKAVVKLMKDPVGVRNAILVNEILSRPRSLRK